MKPKQVRRNLTKTAQSRQQRTPVRPVAQVKLQHGKDLRRGLPLTFYLPGLAGFYEWSDSSLLKFITQFLDDNGIMFPDCSGTPSELALAECVVIARVVQRDPDADRFTFPLPGLAANRALTADAVLHYLATRWHEHHAIWKGMHWLRTPAFEFAQMNVVCESILVRAGTLEEMPNEGPSHRAAFKAYADAMDAMWKAG